MKRKFAKILSLTLVAIMVFSIVPAFAEDTETAPVNTNGYITIEDAVFDNTYNETDDGQILLVSSTAIIMLENDVESYNLDIDVLDGYDLIVYGDPFLSQEVKIPADVSLNQGETLLYAFVQNKENENENGVFPILICSYRTPTKYKDADKISGWAREAVDFLNQTGYGILVGDENKNFNPQKDITRYEMAVIVTKLMGIDPQNFKDYGLIYDDDIANWAAPYVRCAAAMNVMVGQKDGDKTYFNGALSTTRQEYCKIICDFMFGIESYGLMDTNDFYNSDKATQTIIDFAFSEMNFVDESELSAWAAPYVKTAVFLGVINGADNNGKLYLNPKQNITRQEVCVIIYNMIKEGSESNI